MPSGSRHVVLGAITGAHGIRGEVRLQSFTEQPEDIAAYGPLVTPAGEEIEIVSLKPARSGFIARLKSVDDRNRAEALKGTELRLDRDRLPKTDEDEFYHADLVGLRAELQSGELFGEVVAVHDFGAGDLLEIRRADGSDTVLMPFTATTVPVVEIGKGRIVVDPPGENDEE